MEVLTLIAFSSLTITLLVATILLSNSIKELNSLIQALDRDITRNGIVIDTMHMILKDIDAYLGVEEDSKENVSGLSLHEEEMLRRQVSFDERIARFSEELNVKRASSVGTSPDVLHPDVYNIPHEQVPTYESHEKEEYSV